MRRYVLIALLFVLLLGGVSATFYGMYVAVGRVPEFYQAATQLDAESQTVARDEFVARATALAGDLTTNGRWQTLLTAEAINAWLALELKAHYPDLLPDGWREPRIEILADEATIACRYHDGRVDTVLSLSFDAYLHEPNVVALRIRRARAGALPVPLAQVLSAISHAAGELGLRLEWGKTDGDPVALITLPQPRGNSALALNALELRQGELFASGLVGAPSSDQGMEPRFDPTAGQEPATSDESAESVAEVPEKETIQK